MSEQGSIEIPASAENTQRENGLRQWVENRVLQGSTAEVVDLGQVFSGIPVQERVGILYDKLMAHSVAQRIIQEEKKGSPDQAPEPVDPYLVAEIKSLWDDEPTQQMFVSRFAEARVDAKLQRHSELGKKWEKVNEDIEQTREAFEEETRRLFLQQVTRPDQVSAAQGRTQRFAGELIKLNKEREGVISLEGVPPTSEHTDVAAGIMFEQLARYHDEANDGFVWLPSRVEIHIQTTAALQNGRWPVLRGEAGSGKSEQADAAAVALTGEQPTHIACGPNTSSRELIADSDIDPGTGGSYETYGPVMQAATGFESSLQDEPRFKTGRVVRLDESGRLGTKGYSEIKEVRQKRTAKPADIEKFKRGEDIEQAKLLHGKPVLPGFSAILTTNPEGPRYPDRREPDPAMRRELSYITVDYPPMTGDDPELYEFMLATLMDDNKHISVPKSELAPMYVLDESEKGKMLPDGSKVVKAEKVFDDPTNKFHGTLYRFSFAVRSIQDAFNAGNMISVPENALRYDPDSGIVTDGGDPLTLSTSTITLGEVASWMKGFRERRLKDEGSYHVDSLSMWLNKKIDGYINQADEEDRDKIRAVFEHFNLLTPQDALKDESPIIPKEIGYLSPRVKRPVEFEKLKPDQEGTTQPHRPDHEHYDNRQVVLEDESAILATLKSYEFTDHGKPVKLKDGRRFRLGDGEFRFVGFTPDEQNAVVEVVANEGIHRLVSWEQIISEGEFDNRLEDAIEIMGADFLGPEAVKKAFGIELSDDEVPELEFTQDELERAKALGQRLILRVDRAQDGSSLTMDKIRKLAEAQFQLDPTTAAAKGKALYQQDWYNSEAFFTTQTPRMKWALVGKDVLPGSTGKHYLDQTIAIADFLVKEVLDGPVADEHKEALADFRVKKPGLEDAMIDVQAGSGDWKKLAKDLSELKLNQMFRQTPAEVLYDMMMVVQNTEGRFLPDKYTWTNKQSQDGYLVNVGGSDADGANVNRWSPNGTDDNLGVAFSR